MGQQRGWRIGGCTAWVSVIWVASAIAQAPGPRSWALATFRDSSTGISFRYPAAFQPVEDVKGYFSPALTQIKGPIAFRVKLAFRPPPTPGTDEATTDLGQLSFVYATLPVSSETACRKQVEGWGEDSDKVETLNVDGVEFAVGQVSDAGLSHFVRGEIYAAFRGRTCYLFEEDTIGLDGYAGDVKEAQWKQFDRHLSAIIRTVRFPVLRLSD
jgi:hypothetical protein